MKFFRNIVLGVVILGLFSMMSPAIKDSFGHLVTSFGSDTNHAVSTVAESGGLSDTWNSLTKFVGDVVNEATH